MIRVLGTGLTGLVGTRIREVLPEIDFTFLSRSQGVDLTDFNAVEEYIASYSGTHILHMAALTDVDGCESEKDLGEKSEAWIINVEVTREIARLCLKYRKILIYISTDFVFDGEKKEGEGYGEEDTPNPINWYGKTKFEGEKAVTGVGVLSAILRIAYPYGISSAPKKDFVRIIAERLKSNQPVKAVTDHIFVPTYIDDIAYAIKKVIEENATGIVHVVGDQPLTPFLAAQEIAKAVGKDPSKIEPTTREEYFASKALRPLNLYLKNDRIKSLNVSMRTFEQGLSEMKNNL